MASFRLLLLAAFAGSLAATAAGRGCPAYEDVANLTNAAVAQFDINRYTGFWYEIYSHNLPLVTSGCECTRYNVFLESGGWGTEFNCRKGQATPTTLHSDNKLSADAKLPGMLTESWQLPFAGHSPATAYWVLDVGVGADGDYSKALVYSCTNLLFAKREWIYYFSREQTLSAEDYASWTQYLQGKGVSTSDVKHVPQNPQCWNGEQLLV
eukprot:TRINITY_DN104441_c0_g1_i1.p1 TRINITY_DN104441_c0_g1~~TRINITY_DN104441_c0_g1_i1.p1  ORF type:complete len:210 (-),score=31.04 TRINITY_DN104441_c0_g1_i1:81-710(-)